MQKNFSGINNQSIDIRYNIYQGRIASSVLTNYYQMSALSSFQEFPEAVAMPVDGREEYIESVGYRVFTITTRRRRRRRRATYLLSRIIASSIWAPISSISPKSYFFDWITFDVSYIREYKKIKRFENNFLYPITLFWSIIQYIIQMSFYINSINCNLDKK